MLASKFIFSIFFLALFLFNLYDFFKKNTFSPLLKRTILFFLFLVYFFFLVFLFLEQGGIKFRFYSELYLVVGLILLIILIIEETFFYYKSLMIFFSPFLIYILFLGFHFLNQEKRNLFFNLIEEKRFDPIGEIFFLLAMALIFYSLILSILYRQLFLEHKFKKTTFLANRLPSLTKLNFLISFNLNLGIIFFCFKAISLSVIWLTKNSFIINYKDLMYSFGIILLLSFFGMVSFFRFKHWLHSKSNLIWLYWGNLLLILYLLFLY